MTPGLYRRRVLLRSDQTTATGDMEDDPHRFGVDIIHDGNHVTGIGGRAIRVPWATCPMATEVLCALVGKALLPSPFDVLKQIEANRQCTHMVDAAALAIAAAARGIVKRRYDVTMTISADAVDRRECVTMQDGEVHDRWMLVEGIIESPERFAGRALYKVGSWHRESIAPGAECDLLFIMRHAYIAASARRLDLNVFKTAEEVPAPDGACFTHTRARKPFAHRILGSERRFDDMPDGLLADLENQTDERPEPFGEVNRASDCK